ncbi:MAG TPA: FCD domain-containing protein [Allosphingosinicella sp.]|nr:FCD domain-containing protein [Allosphingosinicella sp.]
MRAVEEPGGRADAQGRNLTFAMLEALGRAIVTGAYETQRFPTEAELAVHHDVSRSVTREAVKMLTAKGLLTARPRKGTTVQPSSSWNLFDTDVLRWLLERKFSLELLRQFSELRIAIEPEAAALAALGADPAAVAEIRKGYERMEAAEATGEDTLDADIAFHVAILNASANPFYMQFRDVVATALRTSIRFTNRFKGRTASLPAHHAVLVAIEAGDGLAARGAMAAIIAEVMSMIEDSERAG